MTTKFVLHAQKVDSARRCPVYLMAYLDGLRLVHSTGEKCKPSDWNADWQKFRASYPLAEEANQLLARLAADTLTWRRKLPAPEVTVIKQESVTVWYEEYGRSMKARGYAFETLRQNLLTRNCSFDGWQVVQG